MDPNNTDTVNPIKYKVQEIENATFNDTYNVSQRAMYGFDTVSDAFQPMQAQIPYDYVGVNTSGSTSDVYTFYQGGSGGTLVSTVTLQYSDSSKATLSYVART